MVLHERRRVALPLSLLLFCLLCILYHPSSPTRASPRHRQVRGGSLTTTDDDEAEGAGTLASPCTASSDYTHARLEQLYHENSPHYAACRDCIGSGAHAATACPSQYGTDLFLMLNFFRCRHGPGLYLDVGAHHPEQLSVSWVLDYCLGWRGICVEASAALAGAFPRAGRSCTVVQRAVALRRGSGRFAHSGTLVGAIEDVGSKSSSTDTDASEEVIFTTLEEVLVQQNVSQGQVVDFLNLDVEGFELEGLAAYPFARNPVAFASVENVAGTKDTAEYLLDRGFVALGELGVDTLWAALPQPLVQLQAILPYLRIGHAKMRQDTFGIRQYDTPSLLRVGWLRVQDSIDVNRTLAVWEDVPEGGGRGTNS